jgi:hypothetical protein
MHRSGVLGIVILLGLAICAVFRNLLIPTHLFQTISAALHTLRALGGVMGCTRGRNANEVLRVSG